MAAKIGGPGLGELSRFSVLAPGDSESSEDENVKYKDDEAKKKAKNAKKRARKKKKTAADSAATAELRQMAFGGPSKQSKKQNPVQPSDHSGNVVEEKPSKSENAEWVERDEQFIVNQFQEDLEEALRQSLEEAAHLKQLGKNGDDLATKKKKKDHSVKLSLDQFQKQSVEPEVVDIWQQNSNKDLDRFDDLPAIPKTENTQKKTKKKKSKNREIAEKTQAVQVMDEAMKNTNDAEKVNNQDQIQSLDPASIQHWMNEVEKRDKENELLRTTMLELKEELAGVKKRNKQLCFILGQGEMRDKSEILQQVDVLTNVKDELSLEISELHSQLEQERSKVSVLKLELAKFQNGRSKKHSHTEGEHR